MVVGSHHQVSGLCVSIDGVGRIDYSPINTGLDKITDVGFKAFSTALGSSSTITTVKLACKYV